MKYRKKPVVVEAFQFGVDDYPKWFPFKPFHISFTDGIKKLECSIPTPEGDMKARHGDMIIKGVQGEIYPCKKDIFDATYEKVEE